MPFLIKMLSRTERLLSLTSFQPPLGYSVRIAWASPLSLPTVTPPITHSLRDGVKFIVTAEPCLLHFAPLGPFSNGVFVSLNCVFVYRIIDFRIEDTKRAMWYEINRAIHVCKVLMAIFLKFEEFRKIKFTNLGRVTIK